jgi:hypothetical protein
MSTDCSFFGGFSGNPACANWWITGPFFETVHNCELQKSERPKRQTIQLDHFSE